MSSVSSSELVGVGVGVVREPQGREDFAHQPRIGPLVEQSLAEPVELGAGLLLDKGAPELDQSSGAARRLESGHAFAREHRNRVLQRRFLARARLRERTAVVPIVEHGGDVRRDALHATRADGFDPRLLDCVKQGAGRRALGREAPVEGVTMAREAQGEEIGEAANDRRLARIWLARGLGEPRLRAFR